MRDLARRLGVERIDLYQFHRPDESGVPVEDSWGEMTRLMEEGKVRLAGVSNFDVGLLERCEAIRHVDTLQPPFSMIQREAVRRDPGALARHRCHRLQPDAVGILTDRFTRDRVDRMAPDDWRRRSIQFQEPNLTATRAAGCVAADRGAHGSTVSAAAVAWTLSWRGCPAHRRRAFAEQVDGWVAPRTSPSARQISPKSPRDRAHRRRQRAVRNPGAPGVRCAWRRSAAFCHVKPNNVPKH
jgi:aryl-alcohol dehydrogenase-like predicted oxidoreductase